jgi:hypothetical protein
MKVVILQNDLGAMQYLILPLKEVGIKAFQYLQGAGIANDDVLLVRSSSKPIELSGVKSLIELNRQENREMVYNKITMKNIMINSFNKRYLITGRPKGITVLKKKHHQAGNGVWFLTNPLDIKKIKDIYDVYEEPFIPFDKEGRLIVFGDNFIFVEKILTSPEKAIGGLVRGGLQGYRYKYILDDNIAPRGRKQPLVKDFIEIVKSSRIFGLDCYTIDLGFFRNKLKVIELNSTLPMPLFNDEDKIKIGSIFRDYIKKIINNC